MLLYDAANPAPNPRRVRIFLAEKNIDLPVRVLSIVGGEHKAESFLAVNPLGQLPALLLDSGDVLTESVSICRYLEAIYPEKPLFGTSPQGTAEIDMWIRRVEFRLMQAIGGVWLHTHPFTARVVVPQYKDYGESNRPRAAAAMKELDKVLRDRPFLAGDSYSVADIVLLTTIDFASFIGIAMPEEATALAAWHARVSARPSAAA